MADLKCKMCGMELTLDANQTTATCEYCGSQQTLPRYNDDKTTRLYDRANHFRRNNEFDKAMGVFEQILDENPEDAESYWSIVLCRYGIQYVEDPLTHKRLPTVNRVQHTSIFDDDNYRSALQYADMTQKRLYESEAAAINEIQKRYLEISEKEEPFDVFICYKETDENKQRTRDSVYANELYHELSNQGFKVFFAKITLEDKLGVAYEPYIFAALNSAKVMVVLGTKPEYFKAVWVKNEWSRFLTMIKNGEKKMLIPAYRDMDPYDLPEEFSHLQAQDMNKLGFMPDLVRGITKILEANKKPEPTPAAPQQPPVGYGQPPMGYAPSNQLYRLRLISDNGRKLDCIKIVREITGYGLVDAKNLVERIPCILADQLPLQDAEEYRNRFIRHGIDVSLEAIGGQSVGYAPAYQPSPAAYAPQSTHSKADTEALLKRIALFLENGDWSNADLYCERALDKDPENAQVYIYKMLVQIHGKTEPDLAMSNTPLEGMTAYKNAIRFADDSTVERLIGYNNTIKENIERAERERAEQARRAYEKKEREDRIRKNRMALQTAKENSTQLITQQLQEKAKLEAALNSQKFDLEMLKKTAKKSKWNAFMVLLMVGVMLGTLIAIGNAPEVTGVQVFLLLGGLFAFITYSIKLLKSTGKSALLCILNLFTYGIFSTIHALIVFLGSKKKKADKIKKEITLLESRLQQVESQINVTRSSLNEINKKINNMN